MSKEVSISRPEPAKSEFEWLDGVLLATLVEKELDAHTTARVKEELFEQIVDNPPANLCVDMVNVQFLDNTFLRALVDLGKFADAEGANLYIVNVSPAVYRAMGYSGILEHLNFYESKNGYFRH